MSASTLYEKQEAGIRRNGKRPHGSRREGGTKINKSTQRIDCCMPPPGIIGLENECKYNIRKARKPALGEMGRGRTGVEGRDEQRETNENKIKNQQTKESKMSSQNPLIFIHYFNPYFNSHPIPPSLPPPSLNNLSVSSHISCPVIPIV